MIRTFSLRHGALCLLLGALAWVTIASVTIASVTMASATLAWGQSTSTAAPAMKAAHSTGKAAPKATSQPASAAKKDTAKEESKGPAGKIAPDAAVITIPGVCNHPAASKAHPASASTCKTVVSRAEFEKVIAAIQPDMPESARRQFAERYAMALAMAGKARQMGLDHGAQYEEMEKLMRLQVLTQILLKDMREKATVTDQEVEDYYKKNPSAYEEISLERVYVPKLKQPSEASANPSDPKARQETADAAADMKKEADNLRARAVAGEDFAKLQAEAFETAGMKTPPPNTKLTKLRRNSIPPDQGFVFNLKPGEVSEVSTNPNGYLFYKLDTKEILPLNSVKEEIHNSLQNQRMQDTMESIRESTKPEYNDRYFAAAAPAMPHGGMAMQHPAVPSSAGSGAGQPPRSRTAQ